MGHFSYALVAAATTILNPKTLFKKFQSNYVRK